MNAALIAVFGVGTLLVALVVAARLRSVLRDRGKPIPPQRQVELRHHWLVQEWPHTKSLGERWVCVPPNTSHDRKWPGIKFFGAEEAARKFIAEQPQDR